MAINVLSKTKTPKGEHAMRTRRELYPQTSEMYICELDECPLCGEQLELSRYSSGHKIVQKLSSTVEVGYWPKQCDSPGCTNYGGKCPSAEWQQIAPMYCTYGFDVITTIGWQRQTSRCTFDETMKVELRKTIRKKAGDIIRPEHVEQPGVLMVTGLLPSPVIEETPAEEKTEQHSVDQVEQERQSIVDSLIRRVRYLLRLKGRPPFRMADIEMYQGFREVCDFLEIFIAHIPDLESRKFFQKKT